MVCYRISIQAQEDKEELIKIDTNVVFVDVLVKEKRTGAYLKSLFQPPASGFPHASSG